MAIFGWIVVLALALILTLAAAISLLFGGLDLSRAPIKYWVIVVPSVGFVWWLVISWAPFAVVAH